MALLHMPSWTVEAKRGERKKKGVRVWGWRSETPKPIKRGRDAQKCPLRERDRDTYQYTQPAHIGGKDGGDRRHGLFVQRVVLWCGGEGKLPKYKYF